MTTQNQLPRSTPEAQGIPSAAIKNFVDAVEQQVDALHSFMLVRHGQVVAEGWWAPYGPEHQHVLFSLSKSFTSTAIGLAVAEGRLTVEDRVIAFFPEDLPADVSENLAAMRVHDLLAMATGHIEDTTGYVQQAPDGNWVKAFLARPVDRTPGTHFVYNSGATYMLSAIIQKITGQKLIDYLQPRLFQPLGIENPWWESCPRGINVGGWGLNVRTEDIARFGQMYLQKGVWQGKQLVPQAWVEAATSRQVANDSQTNIDWRQGYGYQFWRCQHGAYRGDGAFGQYCIVMPEQDAVLAITSGLGDMQVPLNLVWEHLLPAFGSAVLPENKSAQQALANKLASLMLPVVQGAFSSPMAAKISGQRYRFDPNERKFEAFTLTFTGDKCQFTLEDEYGVHKVAVGNGVWQKGVAALDRRGVLPIAASGAWTADDTYVIKAYFYTTPFSPTITCRFVDGQLLYDHKLNVSFGPTVAPPLVGKRV